MVEHPYREYHKERSAPQEGHRVDTCSPFHLNFLWPVRSKSLPDIDSISVKAVVKGADRLHVFKLVKFVSFFVKHTSVE